MAFLSDVTLINPGAEARERVSIEIGDDGRISAIHDSPPAGDTILDGGGELIAMPGFIDIHTHGANGYDIAYTSLEAITTIAEAKLKEGVTTFLPTTWTESRELTVAMGESVAAYSAEGQPFAKTPALHVEGPYLNPDQAGAQHPGHMRDADLEEIRALNEIFPVKLISVAPEMPGMVDFIREMKAMGIVVSAAHSAATRADFLAAREVGLSHMTHYCNQMSPLHHREVGLVGSALLDDEVMIEFIPDKIHLCPDMLELIFKFRSCDRLMMITDSIAASHLGTGRYPLGDTEIIVKDGAARIPAGNLAGSILKFNEGLKNVIDILGIPLGELAKTTAANQARSLGLPDVGTIAPGMLADITVLDANFEVVSTIVEGSERFRA